MLVRFSSLESDTYGKFQFRKNEHLENEYFAKFYIWQLYIWPFYIWQSFEFIVIRLGISQVFSIWQNPLFRKVSDLAII